MGDGNGILYKTLKKLVSLYESHGLVPGAISKIGLKPQWSVVIGTHGQCGIAINFTGIHHVQEMRKPDLGLIKALVGRKLFEAAEEEVGSEHIYIKSIGVAALSALSQPLLTSDSLAARGFKMWSSPHFLERVVKPTDVVTLVGFGGMVQRLAGTCRELHVTDMRPRESFLTTIVGPEIEYGPRSVFIHAAEENESLLGRSDVVLITASALINGTFADLLHYAGGARALGVYGPSASFIPDVLFDKGIHFVMSHHVQDPARFEYDMENATDMESALRGYQRHQTILREDCSANLNTCFAERER
ncbi:MAG: DUF364 domain-containing protein [Syntrophales bacterium LBB04]|nr:DUF364 domain-containing protein [Syntrophales bacterium LBB04]